MEYKQLKLLEMCHGNKIIGSLANYYYDGFTSDAHFLNWLRNNVETWYFMQVGSILGKLFWANYTTRDTIVFSPNKLTVAAKNIWKHSQ